jgi:hypothetical protein
MSRLVAVYLVASGLVTLSSLLPNMARKHGKRKCITCKRVYRPHDLPNMNAGPLYPRPEKYQRRIISGPRVPGRWVRQHTAGIVGTRDQTYFT